MQIIPKILTTKKVHLQDAQNRKEDQQLIFTCPPSAPFRRGSKPSRPGELFGNALRRDGAFRIHRNLDLAIFHLDFNLAF